MLNKSKTKTPMPEANVTERRRNFSEVALGYSKEDAVLEAKRCLECRDMPCVSGCPVGIAIPDFIKLIKAGDTEGAYRVISSSSGLARICGRVCPQEVQCEAKCKRGKGGEPVAIGALERYVADVHNSLRKNDKTHGVTQKNGKKVAIVGSGPAGLSCAGELLMRGYDVTVFEALHKLGGVLSYGIPEFRLPKSIVDDEIESLRKMGAEFVTNVVIGKTLGFDELYDMGYSAIFIGTGAGLPSFMGIPGEELSGVYSANEFLTRTNLMKAYQKGAKTPVYCGKAVAVIGGGNVAMDAARCAVRLGAEHVYIVYRRSMDELPARREEVEHAVAEGVEFMLLTAPIAVCEGEEKGFVGSLKCIKMELGEPDARGRRRPVPVDNSEFSLPVDTVIMAIGTNPNPLIRTLSCDLQISDRGLIVANENGSTSIPTVFAGGDAVTGAATVISAMGQGKRAAAAIDEMMTLR